jgi:hypothetical protein
VTTGSGASWAARFGSVAVKSAEELSASAGAEEEGRNGDGGGSWGEVSRPGQRPERQKRRGGRRGEGEGPAASRPWLVGGGGGGCCARGRWRGRKP